MDFSMWTLLVTLSKIFIYAGVAAAIGGTYIRLLKETNDELCLSIGNYQLLVVSIGIIATAANFFIQVAAFSETGWRGLFDETYMPILWQSSAGAATAYRLIGLFLALAVAFSLRSLRIFDIKRTSKFLVLFFYLLSTFFIAKSFSLIGHTADLSWSHQLLLNAHVVLISWWMGALWPLFSACSILDALQLQIVMHRFGQHAAFTVTVLIICGLLLGFQLVGDFLMLFTSEYGVSLVVKLILVGFIMIIAALHKFVLVPQLLEKPAAAHKLATSIKFEMMVGIFILMATSILTTMVGPAH